MSYRAALKPVRELIPAVSQSEAEGSILLQNADLFRPGRSGLCVRLIESLVREHGACSVDISLEAATCSIRFPRETGDPHEVSRRVAGALRSTFTKRLGGEPAADWAGSWTHLSGYRFEQSCSVWASRVEGPGRIRLRNETVATDPVVARGTVAAVADVAGVASCRLTWWWRELDIRYAPEVISTMELSRSVARTFASMAAGAGAPLMSLNGPSPPVATGLNRVRYYILAAGSFVLTIVGVVLPIVPTVPFLMATSYYLVRASPALNRRLLRSRFFGPILEDLQTWGGLRLMSKLKLVSLALAFGVVTIVLIGPPTLVVLIMVGVYGATITFIARMPGAPEEVERGTGRRPLAGATA